MKGFIQKAAKGYFIKPKIQAHIAKQKIKFDTFKAQVGASRVIIQSPIAPLVSEWLRQIEAFFQDLAHDNTVEPIADIVVRNITQLASKELKERVKKSASAQNLQNYLLSLVDLERYQALVEKLQKIENFKNLPHKEKSELLEFLKCPNIRENLKEDLAKLDLEHVKVQLKKHVEALCKEFSIGPAETKKALEVFNTLTSNHIPALKEAQKAMAKNLPSFFETLYNFIHSQNRLIAMVPDAARTYTPANSAATNDLRNHPAASVSLKPAKKIRSKL